MLRAGGKQNSKPPNGAQELVRKMAGLMLPVPSTLVKDFAHVNHNAVLKCSKNFTDFKMASKQLKPRIGELAFV